MYARFVSQELRNVREQLRSGFDSLSLDNKVRVSFGCAAAPETLQDAEEALQSVSRQITLGLITLQRAKPAFAAAPSTAATRKAGKQPATAAARLKDATRGSTPASACGKAGPSGGRPCLKVEVNGDEILTPLFKYEKAAVEKAYDHPLSEICLYVVLRDDGKDLDCPHRHLLGHKPGGKCHSTNGVNPKDLPHKSRRREDGTKQSARLLHFGGPALK
jgi:hypothetical protein